MHGGRAPGTEDDVLEGRAGSHARDPERQTRRERDPVQRRLHQIRHGADHQQADGDGRWRLLLSRRELVRKLHQTRVRAHQERCEYRASVFKIEYVRTRRSSRKAEELKRP